MPFVRYHLPLKSGSRALRCGRPVLIAGSAVLAVWLAGCTPTEPVISPAPQNPQATAPTRVASQPAAPVPVSREEQHLRILITQVEQAYARGEADYRRGRLAEAKSEFNRAVDLMLLSGLDIKANAALQEEFDRTLDRINGLEMEALKRGNGFTTPEEEAPADVASEVTFKVDPNFVARAQADLATTKSDLPLVVNDYVAAFINFFANTKKGHNTLLHSFQRSGRYKAMIQRVMAEEGVPQDLIYLAVAESGFNPRAVGPMTRSGGRAGGMWQFMPSGNYGLVRNAYVDERFDPEKSTRASARYMKFIYDQLGDWYLTMAGYNWGTGNVQRAVQKTGYADFWELYKRNNLPAETKNYVPEIIAAIIIANHPEQYGFDEIALDPPILTDTVTINYSIDLRLVSDLVGAPISELQALNPSLLRSITPPDTSFDLHLPAGTATLFTQRVATIPESHRNGWRYHRVAADETLASIARQYHVQVDDLASANQLHEDSDLKGVEALAVPSAPVPMPRVSSASSSSSSSASASSSASSGTMYKVRRGDTLVTIADRYGVSLDQLRRWNKISGRSTKVKAGSRLQVSEPASAHRSANRKHASADDDQPRNSRKKHSASSADDDQPRSARSSSKKHAAASQRDSDEPRTSSKRSAKSKRGKHAAADSEAAPEPKSTKRASSKREDESTRETSKHAASGKKSSSASGKHAATESSSSKKKQDAEKPATKKKSTKRR